MPNRKTHRFDGAVAGASAAFALARIEETPRCAVQTVGGAIGGHWGARMRDAIAPAAAPGHRSVGQALVPAIADAVVTAARFERARQHVESWAQHCRARQEAAATEAERLLWWAAEQLCELATGGLSGFVAGYESPVTLDAGTPRGLPLLA